MMRTSKNTDLSQEPFWKNDLRLTFEQFRVGREGMGHLPTTTDQFEV